jgi:hypothetical protein
MVNYLHAKGLVVLLKVAPPAVNSFEDISKIRNKNDKNIRFQTDKDTATQDFYWKYDRGMDRC